MSLDCYGNSDLYKIHRTRKFWSIPSKSVDINLLHYVLVHCDLHTYFKLEGVTIEKSNRATLSYSTTATVRQVKDFLSTKFTDKDDMYSIKFQVSKTFHGDPPQ